MKNPARPSRAHPQTPERAERVPVPFGIPLTPSPPTPGRGSAPHPSKGRGAPRVLRCSTEREWFHLTPQQCSICAAPSTFALTQWAQAVPRQAVGFFPSLCLVLLEAKPLPAPRSVLLVGGPMASSGKGPKPDPRGALGPRCKALGVCHGCWWPAGFIWGLLRWAGSYNWVPCKSPNLDWKCWV